MFGGRFRLQRAVDGPSESGTVMGTDSVTGEAVAIRALSTKAMPAGALMRLEHEARLLRRVRNRWLAPVLDFGWEGDLLYLVSGRAPGVSLAQRLQAGPLDVRDALTVGRCLFSALRDLHRHRVLHRDINPQKLIVNPEGPLTAATLVGFGLARSIWGDCGYQAKLVHAAMYASPEQAGSIDQDVGEASDLYSAGVVLFETVAGRPPFQSESVGTILFEHLTAKIPELRSLGHEIPSALDELIQRLLRKDPRDRYQSAEAVMTDLEAIANALRSGKRDPCLVIGASDHRCSLTEPAFVARVRELEQVDTQIERARGGEGGLVLLEGESGAGKTRLLVETAQRAARDGFWVLRGQGSSEVGQRPRQLLDGVVEEFVSAARSSRELADAVRRKLEIHRDALSAALPKLARALDWESLPQSAPEAFGEERCIRALVDFLDATGTESRPALIVLDDCHWADEFTCKLIQRWQTRRSEASRKDRYVLVLAAFRTEHVSQDHLLRQVRSSAHLRLSPFQPEDIRRLAESMAGPLPPEAVALVGRLAEGSPFMASAVLRGLVESGALVTTPGGWRIEPLAMADLQSSSRAASFLTRRIELLPKQAVELLSVGAIFGKAFDLHAAARLAEQQPAEALAALDEARQRRLVWARPDGTSYAFVHDKIRSAFLNCLSGSRRRELHLRAAQHLQKHAPQRVSDVAYHFDAAGENRSALPYALQAAEQARAQHSLEVAEQQYRIAERGARSADTATRYGIAEGLGDVLMLRGRYDAAAQLFESAMPLAEGKLARAQIQGKLGELAFKRGDMEAAIRNFESALRILGRYVPRRFPVFVLLLVWEALVQLLHTLLPPLFVHRLKREPAPSERLVLRQFSGMAHGCWYTRSVVVGMWAHLRGMNLAERYLPTLELANAYSEHAPAMTLVPAFRRAITYAQRSFAIRESLGDLWGQGQSLHYHGVALYAASRYRECIEKCSEAVRLLERMGDYWQVHIARYQIAASLYRLGRFRQAVEEAKLNHKSGLELGDEQASGIILDVWARATGGAVPEEILQQELKRKRHDAQGTSQVLMAEGVRLTAAGEFAQAAETFQKATTVTNRSGVRNTYILPNFAWRVTALRCLAESETGCVPDRRRALVRQAERAARQALRAMRISKNDLPHVAREYALIRAMRGRLRSARRFFQRSLAEAERQGARYERAQTLLALGRVGREVGWSDAEKHLAEALVALDELVLERDRRDTRETGGEPATLSLTDRFDTVLDSGRKIAAALSKEVIYREVADAARKLLRGERSLVLDVHQQQPGPRLTPVAGEVQGEFPRAVIDRALQAGRAVTCDEEESDQIGNAAGSSSEGSSLCVPICARGRTVACLYVSHRQVHGMFGPDEERLADFIATIAGAALENAEGFEQLTRLNETLELRVAERTAAAEARARELAQSNLELERVADELRHTEEQLRVAINEAESANRAKSRFLATISHEIRTPMNGVLGMTELALKTPLTPQQRGYLNTVRQSGDSLLLLLNDILDFSKIEAGRMELETIGFPLRQVVGDSVQVLAVPAFQKGLELICRVRPDVPEEVLGDPGRLRQVLVNLIGNAIKFTEQGEVLVDVSLEQSRADGTELHFAVHDTGVGIPPERQQSVFEAFRQTDSSTTRRFGGSGLGLSISSELVKLMNGRIWVESEPGRGSTFHCVVPFRLPEQAPQPRGAPADMHDFRALVVSSNSRSRTVYVEMLTSYGMDAVATGSEQDALPAIRRAGSTGTPFRLLVVDAGTSTEKRGTHILESQRELGDRCPIILLMPADRLSFEVQDRESSTLICLTKPVKHSELLEAVKAAIGVRENAHRPRAAVDRNAGRPRLQVLLAEDGPVNQEVAAGLLELRGHQVQVVQNGQEALQALQQGAFDVVLMDVEMPVMDGIEATSAIRESEKGTDRRTPIIALTAHAIQGFEDRCRAAGMDAYISKPLQPEALYQTLESVVETARHLETDGQQEMTTPGLPCAP